MNYDDFFQAYLVAALWSNNDESDESGGQALDLNYDIDDIAEDSRQRLDKIAREFFDENSHLFTDENYIGGNPDGSSIEAMAGHDFWLTQNGHGAGFWDGDWKDDIGDILTAKSKKFGEIDLYIGDDKEIHCM